MLIKIFLILVGLLKTDQNAKITEIVVKIPSISSLATKSTLVAFENKTPDVGALIKKQIMTQKYQTLKRKLLIMIVINTLLLQNLMIQQRKVLLQAKPINFYRKINSKRQNMFLLKIDQKTKNI